MDDPEGFEGDPELPVGEWDEFGEDSEPIGIEGMKRLDLANMPEDVRVLVMDDYFPETTIWREGELQLWKSRSTSTRNTGNISFPPMPLPGRWNVPSGGSRRGPSLCRSVRG